VPARSVDAALRKNCLARGTAIRDHVAMDTPTTNHDAAIDSATRDETARRSYAARINAVVDHVVANLDGDLSVAALARIAHFSPFHFHRQFRAYTGISVARLVRLLRLRRAALRLAFSPDQSITDIAFESGFGSTDAFSRAFRQAHGCSPTEFRNAPRWSTPEIVPALARLQETRMNTEVEIVDFPATRVAAVEYQGPPAQEYSAIGRLVAWRREHGVGPDRGMTIGIHYNDPATTPPEAYRIDICVSFDGPIAPNLHGVVAKEIPAGRCARVRHFGTREYIAEAEYLYREWLPASGEELRDDPPFFHYVNVGPNVAEADMITDVYLPLE
jgi:AraC family transcriptional regulator